MHYLYTCMSLYVPTKSYGHFLKNTCKTIIYVCSTNYWCTLLQFQIKASYCVQFFCIIYNLTLGVTYDTEHPKFLE